ncbi:MAG TPA: molybdenum cofactor biosynthesis protein MoaE [Bacteroidota bacterium]|nr:molybdenum cofactor biosynthesis protein MoaE [Bacteroidota bacterium]
MIAITQSPINLQEVVASVVMPETGGINVFVGTTRNHSHGRAVTVLEYEAYEPMALKMMNEIVEQARQTWEIQKVSMVHRVGTVPIGESSVVIAVSAAHRDEAFKACRFLIDELKRVVPIWKREYFADGTVEWSHHAHQQLAEDRH